MTSPESLTPAAEDKNGHRIDADGTLVFDNRCHWCNPPGGITIDAEGGCRCTAMMLLFIGIMLGLAILAAHFSHP